MAKSFIKMEMASKMFNKDEFKVECSISIAFFPGSLSIAVVPRTLEMRPEIVKPSKN
ncbi:hypothetical protein YC2023_092408 [Brassica napus]